MDKLRLGEIDVVDTLKQNLQVALAKHDSKPTTLKVLFAFVLGLALMEIIILGVCDIDSFIAVDSLCATGRKCAVFRAGYRGWCIARFTVLFGQMSSTVQNNSDIFPLESFFRENLLIFF